MQQLKQLAKFFVLFLSLSIVTQTTHAKSPTITEKGNIIHIKVNNSEYILLGDPGLEYETNYQFQIPIKNANTLNLPDDLVMDEPILPTPNDPLENKPNEDAKDQNSATGQEEPQIDISSLLTQANYLYNKSQYNEALKIVEHGIKLNPKSAKAYSMRGSLMYVLGNKEAAKADWGKSAAIEPNNAKLNEQMKELK